LWRERERERERESVVSVCTGYVLTIAGRKLSGKVAIVTGASSGIGEAIARGLATEGAKVALAARRIENLEKLQKQIEDEGGIAVCIKTDVTVRDEVSQRCMC
jgi:NADP-dependent 3-hydroxy acid dehydrogenase YdfG